MQESLKQTDIALNGITHALKEPLGSRGLLDQIAEAFEQPLAIVDLELGEYQELSEEWLPIKLHSLLPLCRQVALTGKPDFVYEETSLGILASPLPSQDEVQSRVALLPLLLDRAGSITDFEVPALALGIEAKAVFEWSCGKSVWPPHGALELLRSKVRNWEYSQKTKAQQQQISDITGELISTFDELNMLHRLTERISLRKSTRELCDQAVRWLSETVPAQCIVSRWENTDTQKEIASLSSQLKENHNKLSFVHGQLPMPETDLDAFFEGLGPEARQRSMTLNRDQTECADWNQGSVSEVATAPIIVNEKFLGWIGALNYRHSRGARSANFGVAESSLLTSVAAILGVHAGNRNLYQLQTDLFRGSIGAMVEAIDAKDPYTRGHSDRVARLAVRLAQQLGLEEESLDTIYLGGLLHDIGKIGIDDQILRKPGKLTDEEFEHIKTHPQRGMEILMGVPQLSHLLPIVLHHHESWDGSGYPHGLLGEETPLLARIVAVADAADAMGSDRVYRSGMPIEKVEAILQEGAGKQWDPNVVEAYMQVKDDLNKIVHDELAQPENVCRLRCASSPVAYSI